MSKAFWQQYSIKGGNGNTPKTRGLAAREAQVVDASQDADPVAEAGRHGTQGSMAASSALNKAKAARNRQARFAAGQPMYDENNRFIGNKPPK